MRIKCETILRGIKLYIDCEPHQMVSSIEKLHKKAAEYKDQISGFSFEGLGIMTQDMVPNYIGSNGKPIDFKRERVNDER